MLELDRNEVSVPLCLAGYDHLVHSWKCLDALCKQQVRMALVNSQRSTDLAAEVTEYGVLCAYCEGAIYAEGHIEHFRRKNPQHFPELTFQFSNLFLVCGAKDHCGHYKDGPATLAYSTDDLIKPDEMKPEHYLYFHSSGEVRPQERISPEDKHIAAETIRVLGLNNGSLPNARKKALSVYENTILAELDEIAAWPESERDAYLQQEVQESCWQPYATTIKHFLVKANWQD